MFLLVNERFFAASISAPKKKYEVGAGGIKVFYNAFGKLLPAVTAMATGFVRLYGESVVE